MLVLVAFARAVGWVVVWLLYPECGLGLVQCSLLLMVVWAVAPPVFFRGGAVRFFSVPLGLGLVYSLVVAFCLLEINSYLSKKKKCK